MLYAAVIEYISDTEKIGLIRPQHRLYLTQLKEKGQLFAAGPFLDDFGALIIYKADSLAEAESFILNDPFYSEKVFVRWQIRPWKVVMMNAALAEIPA
jgi:uncharacterized protein YciI